MPTHSRTSDQNQTDESGANVGRPIGLGRREGSFRQILPTRIFLSSEPGRCMSLENYGHPENSE
jgi:hypothetical protein